MKDESSIVRAREALRGAWLCPIEVVRSAGSTVIQVEDAVFSGTSEGEGRVEVGLDRREIDNGDELDLMLRWSISQGCASQGLDRVSVEEQCATSLARERSRKYKMYNQIKLRYVSAVSTVYIQGLRLAYDY